MVAFLQVEVNGLSVKGPPCRQPPAPLRVFRTGARSAGVVLRQSVLPGAQEAPPAVDALFDLFEFALSPSGLAAVFGLIALGFLWDFATAVDNRTLLGQKRQMSVSILGQTYSTDSVDAPSRFAIKFSATVDGFYESPSGGAERVEAGVAYVEEFDDLSACVALGKALQRRFGKDKVEFQTFEVRGSDWMERKASSAALTGKKMPGAAAKPPQAQDQAPDSAQTDTASEDPVDQGNSRLARRLCSACVDTMRRTPQGSLTAVCCSSFTLTVVLLVKTLDAVG